MGRKSAYHQDTHNLVDRACGPVTAKNVRQETAPGGLDVQPGEARGSLGQEREHEQQMEQSLEGRKPFYPHFLNLVQCPSFPFFLSATLAGPIKRCGAEILETSLLQG